MNCEELKGVLNAFLNGRLSGEASRSVRRHFASCAACASLLSAADRIEILPALDDSIDPSGTFAARFHSRLHIQQRKPVWKYPWTLASAAALILGVGIFLSQYLNRTATVPENQNDLPIAENLPLLEDMAVIQHLDLLENFDAIENLTKEERGEK